MAERPQELLSLTPSPSLCSVNFSLQPWGRGERNLLFISCSNCSKSGRNRPKTTNSDFWWKAFISAEPEQDQDLPPALGTQKKVSAVLGWKGKPGSSWLMLSPVPGCAWGRDRSSAVADVAEPAWLSPHALPAVIIPAGAWSWSMRVGEMSQALLAEQRSFLMPPRGSGML